MLFQFLISASICSWAWQACVQLNLWHLHNEIKFTVFKTGTLIAFLPKQTNNKTKRIPFLLICLCPLRECTGIRPGELDSGLIWAHPLPRECSFSNWGGHRTECEDHEKSHKNKRLQTVQTKLILKNQMGNEFEMFPACSPLRWAPSLQPWFRTHDRHVWPCKGYHITAVTMSKYSGTPSLRFNAIVCKITVFLSTVHAQVCNLIQLVRLQKGLLIFSYHQHEVPN